MLIPTIESGQPWENLIEAQFGVQRRLADAKFVQAETFAEIEDFHAAFVQLFNTTRHWAHRDRTDDRRRLLQEMKGHLAADGRIFLSTWQFLDSPRQRRKVTEWEEVGLAAAEVEPNDCLLTWQRGGAGRRYVCLIDAEETAALANESGL